MYVKAAIPITKKRESNGSVTASMISKTEWVTQQHRLGKGPVSQLRKFAPTSHPSEISIPT